MIYWSEDLKKTSLWFKHSQLFYCHLSGHFVIRFPLEQEVLFVASDWDSALWKCSQRTRPWCLASDWEAAEQQINNQETPLHTKHGGPIVKQVLNILQVCVRQHAHVLTAEVEVHLTGLLSLQSGVCSLVSLGSLLAWGEEEQTAGVRLTNYHCIIDVRDPVAAEPPARCKTAQSSPLPPMWWVF